MPDHSPHDNHDEYGDNYHEQTDHDQYDQNDRKDREAPDFDAADGDHRSGESRTDEQSDEATAKQRLAHTREQLSQLSAAPSLGEIAQIGDALADAREFAVDGPSVWDLSKSISVEEPVVAADLVPEICKVLQRVDRVYLGKGATVLPGKFTGQVYREGMGALAALDSGQLCPDDAAEGRVEHVLEAVEVALNTDVNLRATAHAIRVSGELSITAPGQVGDTLSGGTVSRQVTEVFSVVTNPNRLEWLLRAAALLAGHPNTVRLVSEIRHSALVEAAKKTTPEGRVWLHVLCAEIKRDSPVDPAGVWSELVDAGEPSWVCCWLIAGYSEDTIPAITDNDPIRVILAVFHRKSKINTKLDISDVWRFSNRFEFGALTDPTLFAALQTTLQDDRRGVRRSAVKGLIELASEEWVSGESRRTAIQILKTAVEDDHVPIARTAATGIAESVGEEWVSNESRQAAIQALETVLETAETTVRQRATRGLAGLAGDEWVSSESRQAAIQTLETAFEDDDEGVRQRAAEGIAESVGEEWVSNESRQAAIQALKTAHELETAFHKAKMSKHEADWVDTRRKVSEGLVELAGEEWASNSGRQTAIQALKTAIEDDKWFIREDAAKRLSDLAERQLLTDCQATDITLTLLNSLEDTNQAVRRAVAIGLQTVCESHPGIFATNQSLLTKLSAQLEPTQARTLHLLAGFEELAAHDKESLTVLAPDLRRLLTEQAPTAIQVQALKLLSQLGEPAVGPEEGEYDRE